MLAHLYLYYSCGEGRRYQCDCVIERDWVFMKVGEALNTEEIMMYVIVVSKGCISIYHARIRVDCASLACRAYTLII